MSNTVLIQPDAQPLKREYFVSASINRVHLAPPNVLVASGYRSRSIFHPQ